MTRAAWILVALLGPLAAACSRQQIATPSRALDRPSDVALFCVDFAYDGQLDVDGDGSPGNDTCPAQLPAAGSPDERSRLAAFLHNVCQVVGPGLAAESPRRPPRQVRVLAAEECDGAHRQRRHEALLAPVREAARRLGLNPDYPCCPAGATGGCGVEPWLCSERRLEALVTNTGRGEVAVVDTQAQVPGLRTFGEIQNLHSGKPGFGFLPVGLLPQHVRTAAPVSGTDASGRQLSASAFAVTSNVGSCDLSVIDLQPVAELIAEPRDCDQRSCPRRVTPTASQGPLGARPAWVEVAPWPAPTPRAVAAFPGCGLVAEVDLSSGRLVEAVAFDPRGAARRLPPAELAALRCPAECGAEPVGEPLAPREIPDGGVPDRGAGVPVTLAFEPEGRRLLIGDGAGGALTILPYDPAGADGARLGDPRQLLLDYSVLADGPSSPQRGVDVLRISPRSAAGLFAYAVARDGTVRVIDLDREEECETNPDPRHLQALAAAGAARLLPDEQLGDSLRRFACFPVGATPRSPLAASPGISPPGGALPRDVAFIHLDAPCDPAYESCPLRPDAPTEEWLAASPTVLIGDFAWLLASNGTVQLLQIADYCPAPSFRACFPEQAVARRAALLQTRSVGRPNPELEDLPALPQAAWLSPLDRLGNSRRPLTSRLSDRDPGPRVDTGRPGDPLFSVRIPGLQSASATDTDPESPPGMPRARLIWPAPADPYYLPTDPVCGLVLDEALGGRQDGEPIFRPRTIAAFPDPLAVRNETWLLEWEGTIPGTSRSSGLLLPDATLVDVGGLYCNRGVEVGDKLWLPGCLQNEDCLGGVCVREQSQGSAAGICLPSQAAGDLCRAASERLTVDRPRPGAESTIWAVTWQRRYRILKVEQQRPLRYPIVPRTCAADRPCPGGLVCRGGLCEASDTADRLTLGEIAEPEHPAEQQRCDDRDYGEACDDSAAVGVTLRGAPACDRPGSCPYGWTCDEARRRCEVPAGDTRPVGRRTACRADADERGRIVKRCVLECDSSLDCGVGFVCAHSVYEAAEGGIGRLRPRCLRAPLVAEGTPIRDGASVRPLSRGEAEGVLRACFPEAIRYQVRAGDAFLVRGLTSSAPVLQRVAPDGTCQRPQPGDPAFQAARLRQPRLHLGPRAGLPPGDVRLCPPRDQWISHRLPPPPRSPSCAEALRRGQVTLPSGVSLKVAPQPSRPDVWVEREQELFGSLPLSGPGSCVLTDAAAEAAAPPETCGDGSRPPCARRIHFENPYLNLVLRLPRRPEPLILDGRVIRASEWAVPPEGYTIAFGVVGGFRGYAVNAEVPAGQRAQSLRAATTAPDGSVFIVDEGRLGSASSLRGQLMRLYRGDMDQSFLVR